MNAHERYFARILFKNKVLELKGMAFQQFFVEVMQHDTVAPQMGELRLKEYVKTKLNEGN